MNLLNLETLAWDSEIAAFTAPGLLGKLPEVVPSNTVAGGLSPYFEKYGLKAGTPVAVWSGDNPNSLVGTGAAEPGTAVVSLGTSDTFFASMRDFRTDPEGYGSVFGNPAGGFMSLICFTNGSLAREAVRKACGLSYEEFDRVTPVPAEERLMLPYFSPESTPLVLKPGVKYDFDPSQADGPAPGPGAARVANAVHAPAQRMAGVDSPPHPRDGRRFPESAAAPDHRRRVSG